MHVERFEDPVAWLSRATPFLARDEPRHNLLFGLADTLIRQPDAYPEFHLWLAVDAGDPVGAALQTPPYNVVLAQPASDRALLAIVDAAVADTSRIPGVTGAVPEAGAFAGLWARRTGGSATEHMSEGIYVCRAVRDVPGTTGAPRLAEPDDLDRLIPLVEAFAEEALIALPVRDRSRSMASTRARLHDHPGQGGFWVWEVDGEIVSLTGHGGRTPNGIRIGPVYTPPAHRRRGYATSLVQAQTSWLLAHAVENCFLYTDLANATSNAVYRLIGYQQVYEAVEIGFEAAPDAQPQSGGTGAASAGITT